MFMEHSVRQLLIILFSMNELAPLLNLVKLKAIITLGGKNIPVSSGKKVCLKPAAC